jgi:fluoroquinolone transport system permease protein
MRLVTIVRALGPIDARSVRRDALLRWMVLLPLGLAVLVRLGWPMLEARFQTLFQLDLAPYHTLIASSFLVLVPQLFGMVIGFLLLDQRDDRTLMALQVTPMSLGGYLTYRVIVPLVLSAVVLLVVIPLLGLVEVAFVPLLISVLATSALTPLFALFLAAFAANKVQGFALVKSLGIILLPALIAYFVPLPWQLALGLSPVYWPLKLFWELQAGAPGAWLYGLAGLAYHSLLLLALLRRFQQVMSR